MYIHRQDHFLKMNNHKRKGHRCAEVVHYGSGIIAFSHISSYCNEILAVPDTEWQITPRFNHTSVDVGTVAVVVEGIGGGMEGGQLAFVE